MEKRFVYLGILMLAFFAILLLVAAPAAIGLPPREAGLSIAPGHDAYLFVPANFTSFTLAWYNSSQNLDFYVANSMAFNELLPLISLNESLMNASIALEGKGILEIISNSHSGSLPAANSGMALYSNSNITTALIEPYYLIFENAGNKTASVTVALPRIRNPASDVVGFASLGIGMLVFLLLGIGFIAYGVLKKQKEKMQEKEEVSKEEVDALYSRIEKHKGKRKAEEKGEKAKLKGA